MPYATGANGVKIHYEAIGDGFPVLLHTGLAGDSAMWHEAGYVDGLTGYQRIIMDHRGHGESDRPAGVEAHAMARYVADVLAVLDACAAPQAVFWGYSDGARVGYALAADQPDHLVALIATGTIGSEEYIAGRPETAAAVREEGMDVIIEGIRESEGDVIPEWLVASFRQNDPEMVALELESWCSWEGPWRAVQRVTVPTLMLVGEREDPSRHSQRATGCLPDGELVILPGLGHVGAFLHSDLVLPHVRAFLDRVLHSRRGTLRPQAL